MKTYKTSTFTIKSLNEKQRSFLAVASDDTLDRHGEVVPQDKWDIKSFLDNPVIPFGHDYNQPPVAKSLQVGFDEKGRMLIEPQFPTKDVYPFADTIYNLYVGGYMRGFSVGFIDHGDRLELLEVSAVTIPANPNALTLAYKSGVINDAERKQLTSKLKAQVEMLEESGDTVKTATKKGAISQELADDKIIEQKYENMNGFWDIIYAFCDVYFSSDTEPDQFASLVTELVGLLQGLTGATVVTASSEAKRLNVVNVDTKALERVFMKAGAKLSAATLDSLKECFKSLEIAEKAVEDAETVLENLLGMPDDEPEEKSVNSLKSIEEGSEAVETPTEPDESVSDTKLEVNPSDGANEAEETVEEEVSMDEVKSLISETVRAAFDHARGRIQ